MGFSVYSRRMCMLHTLLWQCQPEYTHIHTTLNKLSMFLEEVFVDLSRITTEVKVL